jgi:hypothetical protein
MTIAVYLIAAYPTKEFDSGSRIGFCWSVNCQHLPSLAVMTPTANNLSARTWSN